MKTLTQTDPPMARGDRAQVHEVNIAPWEGEVLSVKWSPQSGWWVDVRQDDGGTWTLRAEDVTLLPKEVCASVDHYS